MTEIRPEARDELVETGPTPHPREHVVRLLYPFWVEQDCLDKAVKLLATQRHTGRKREFEVWHEPYRAHDLYREETLPLVTQALFGSGKGACRYLRVPAE